MTPRREKRQKMLSTFRSRLGNMSPSVPRESMVVERPYKLRYMSPDSHRKMKTDPAVSLSPTMEILDVKIPGYDYIRDLGTGGYARVVLCRKEASQSSQHLAIKIYDKVKTKLKSKVTNISR